ncbi:MFS transporter [Planomonospora venezuelensis]|uniref:MFS family permease n=1 Tax=Planomonospora venezuelensis TaxID=1999 RepID=A0A841D4K6_PLAVE|nr:MFS transporter [Planomonospora venezuelensis]MBB5962396.1 MFS family permease [Planomonospora venezuelensis]GIN00778.1 MFS transporter [Planomonospora venezuelensis]
MHTDAQRARIAVAAVFAVHGAVSGSLATRIPWLQDHLQLGPAELGFALFCPALGAFVAMPMSARLVHRYGGRPVTRVLLALWCAALALPALAPGFGWLCAAFLLYGAAAGMCDVTMNAQGVIVERRLGRSIMSGLHGMWSVGGLAGAGAGVVAAQAGIDARLHHAVMALVLLAAGVAAGRTLLDTRPEPGEQAPPRFAAPSRAILAIGAVGFCATFAEGASQNWAAVYIKDVTGGGDGVAAACYAIFALSMAVTRLAGDLIVRRLGPVTTVRLGGLLATAGGITVVAGRTPPLGIAGFALLGLGVAVVVPLAFAAGGNATAVPGQGVAGVATITYLSGLLAPAATGWIAHATSLPATFGLIAAITLAGALLAGALRPRRVPAPTPVAKPAAV